MRKYYITDQADVMQPERITDAMFGGNGLNVNHGFADPNSVLTSNVEKMSVSSLRFPGGSVTEKWFDMANPDADWGFNKGSNTKLVGMTDFFLTAHQLNAEVNFVLPTRDGFEQSAGEALLNGNYGSRDVSIDFIAEVKDFVKVMMQAAEDTEITLASIEIGNEFWGSGQMTSIEYGKLAGYMTVAIEEALLEVGIPRVDQPQIVVQTLSSAGIYSPNQDRTVYVETVKDDAGNVLWHLVHLENAEGRAERTMLGQGDSGDQGRDLVAQFNTVDGAADAVDAVSDHLYAKKGFGGIDDGQNVGFRQMDRFSDALERSAELPKIEQHVTEWNVKADDGTRDDYNNTKGLQGASLMKETFFEMASHGVSAAQVWPLEGKAGQTALSVLDQNKESVLGLTIAGEMFRMLSESLVGLRADFDFEVVGEVDVHGFSNEKRDVLFVSERSGNLSEFELQLDEVLQGDKYLLTTTKLSDGDYDGGNATAEPLVETSNAIVTNSDSLKLKLDGYSTIRVEITYITSGDDRVSGRDGNDFIEGDAGQDILTGYDGNDTIFGGGGFDELHGGRGNDYLNGGDQADNLYGRSGNDELLGGQGFDRLFGGSDDDLLFGGADDDALFGEAGDDALSGGDGEDRLFGGEGNDVLSGGAQNDELAGNSGFDILDGGEGNDTLTGDFNWDTFVFKENFGNDIITDFDVENDFEHIDLSSVSGIVSFDDLMKNHVSQFGNDALIEDGQGNSITLLNVDASSLTESDFAF